MSKTPLGIAMMLLVAALIIPLIHPYTPPAPTTVDVPPNTKVIGYYWIDEDIYDIYRPMAADESPQDWTAPNASIMSIDVPTVRIHETRLPATPHSDNRLQEE